MKNRKGFTIVELVIVIAVIAILAAVLIPTFSGVISKANQSAAQQTAMQAVKAGLLCITTAQLPENTFVLLNTSKDADAKPDFGYTYTGNQLSDPKTDLYTGEADALVFNTTYTNGKNTILINSDTTLAAGMLTKIFGATSVTINDNTAKIIIGTEDAANAENGDDITLSVGYSNDMPKNAIVFVTLG